MFTHQTVEKAGGRVEITDLDSLVLGQMLEWIYGGKAPDFRDPAIARGLLAATDKYQMDELKVRMTNKI
jgi:hypothetical protein